MRLLLGGVLVMLVIVLWLAARPARAAETPEDVQQWADQAGVDALELAGAVNTTQLEPRAYLIAVGHLEPPRPQLSGVWRLLAVCESELNPRAVSPGGRYRGLFQFDQQTWVSVGGLAFAARADLAAPADQLAAAQRLQARRGWAPWPWCSRYLGLR